MGANNFFIISLNKWTSISCCLIPFEQCVIQRLDQLRALGVPEDAADTLAAASAAASPSLRFQAVEVKHSYSQTDDGSYSCDLTLQTFLDDGSEHGAIDVGDIL